MHQGHIRFQWRRVVWMVALVTAAAAPRGNAQPPADSVDVRQQRTLDSLAAVIRDLEGRSDAAAAPRSGAYMNMGFDGLADFGWTSEPDVGSLQVGDHDPLVRGFTVPNAEISLDGSVDPYFQGFANIVFKLDAEGETGVELEEVYAMTTSLPWNLQLKVGQFLADFGRQNTQHPHAWSFVDAPLVLGRIFGPEGLRSQGVRASWLVPTPFYTEATLGVFNSAGGTTFPFRSEESPEIHGGLPVDRGVVKGSDLLVVPHISTSFDVTDNQVLLLGASAAMGPNNSGPDTRTHVYGADLYWKWKSARAAQGFPFVSFQSEAMVRHYDAAARTSAADSVTLAGAETLEDRGAYAQVLWGIKPRVVLGLRGDRVTADAAALSGPSRSDRSRISPNLTVYPSEFSKVRLQYNYDDRKGLGTDNSLWLQFEFILGAHAAHKF